MTITEWTQFIAKTRDGEARISILSIANYAAYTIKESIGMKTDACGTVFTDWLPLAGATFRPVNGPPTTVKMMPTAKPWACDEVHLIIFFTIYIRGPRNIRDASEESATIAVIRHFDGKMSENLCVATAAEGENFGSRTKGECKIDISAPPLTTKLEVTKCEDMEVEEPDIASAAGIHLNVRDMRTSLVPR